MRVGFYLYFVYSLAKGRFCWYFCSSARRRHESTIFVCTIVHCKHLCVHRSSRTGKMQFVLAWNCFSPFNIFKWWLYRGLPFRVTFYTASIVFSKFFPTQREKAWHAFLYLKLTSFFSVLQVHRYIKNRDFCKHKLGVLEWNQDFMNKFPIFSVKSRFLEWNQNF